MPIYFKTFDCYILFSSLKLFYTILSSIYHYLNNYNIDNLTNMHISPPPRKKAGLEYVSRGATLLVFFCLHAMC